VKTIALTLSIAVAVVVAVSGCGAAKVTTMYVPPRVAFAPLPTLDNVEEAIFMGCLARQWQPMKVRPGVIEATLHLRAHMVETEIDYGRDWFEVRYVRSDNLHYYVSGGRPMIHSNYNGWIKFLVTDLEKSIEDKRQLLAPAPAAPRAGT